MWRAIAERVISSFDFAQCLGYFKCNSIPSITLDYPLSFSLYAHCPTLTIVIAMFPGYTLLRADVYFKSIAEHTEPCLCGCVGVSKGCPRGVRWVSKGCPVGVGVHVYVGMRLSAADAAGGTLCPLTCRQQTRPSAVRPVCTVEQTAEVKPIGIIRSSFANCKYCCMSD